MPSKPVAVQGGKAAPIETDPNHTPIATDDRLSRLRAAMQKISTPPQDSPSRMVHEGPVQTDDRVTRLRAALEEVNDQFLVSQVSALDNLYDDHPIGSCMDKEQTALFESHMDLARAIARKYSDRSEPFEDLYQVALLGLFKAAIRFDPEYGVPFSAFANKTVQGEIRRHFRDHTWAVHVSRRIKELSKEVSKTELSLRERLGRTPTVTELAATLNIEEDEVINARLASTAYKSFSLDSPALNGNQPIPTPSRFISQEDSSNASDNRILVETLLARLPEREALVLRARAGLPPFNGDYSQTEVAEMIGTSQVHVGRIETSGLKRLKALLGDEDIYS